MALGVQRRPLRELTFSHMQKAECKAWKWGEAVNPQSPPPVLQGRLPSVTFADSANSSGSGVGIGEFMGNIAHSNHHTM